MASRAKTRRLDGGEAVDRLSNLPQNLIDLILEHLPVQDVARMSILSKTWRDVWVLHPHLVLDELFFEELLSKKVSGKRYKKDKQAAQVSEVSRTVSNILLVHTGPILKFHLFIPQDLPLHHCVETDFWIKNVSNGVRKLELLNEHITAYKMPLYLFSCLELTHLHLTNCILSPPLGFGDFCNMISVQLEGVVISADMSFGIQLEKLILRDCTGIEHLGCQFTCNNNLTHLEIRGGGKIDLGWFECIQKVKILGVAGVSNSRNEIFCLNKLFSNMPRIKILVLDDLFLELLEPGAATMKRLTMKNLTYMSLFHFEFYDLVRIRNILCLMSSSPNLQSLYIIMDGKVKSKDGMGLAGSSDLVVSSVVQYLQSPTLVGMIFNQLQTVKVYRMVGSTIELQFIKFLLASSPLLRCIKLLNTAIDDPKEESRISKELMSFPRVSKAARIIWT